MKKIIYLLITITFFSCSINVDFFIFNKSGKNIVVKYEYIEISEYNGILSNPTLFEENWLSKLKIIDKKPQLDSMKKEVLSILKPNQAIKIATITNYGSNYEYKRKELIKNLKSLSIETIENSIVFKENKEQLIDKFIRKNNHQYIYSIVED